MSAKPEIFVADPVVKALSSVGGWASDGYRALGEILPDGLYEDPSNPWDGQSMKRLLGTVLGSPEEVSADIKEIEFDELAQRTGSEAMARTIHAYVATASVEREVVNA